MTHDGDVVLLPGVDAALPDKKIFTIIGVRMRLVYGDRTDSGDPVRMTVVETFCECDEVLRHVCTFQRAAGARH
ncbi:hypothetical protein [Rathayibacter toxicus]|nr:hypothetical protein [Rathayibacter toxicus]QOD09003.1 hypothetical protein AYW78_03965 [Rathayibacter toxicus]QWL25800.1 hypothetical protein E2R32_03920 [Rathayibacter toxicus]QWL38392.1 hypothetical protein E2R38_03925 [Rathayibacter toxicus]QWL40481.1 hypothetical protein E2R39_03930 [Rathayibacter toxicus]QWL42584.1 hypothetical protein E2R40_03925 [Rathayibacter toxicus]